MPAFYLSTPMGAGLARRSALLAVGILAGGAIALAPNAARADVNCTAAASNASTCPSVAFLGETIVVDFAAVIAANPNLFSNDLLAWERANQIRINTTSGGPLDLSNARLIATGKTFDGSGTQTGTFTDQALAAWASSASPGSSGVSNYSPSSQQGSNFKQASFTLSPTGNIRGRGLTGYSYTSLKLVLENATLAAIYPTLNISLANYDPADSSNVSVFGTNATLGVPAPLPLAGGAMAFGWSRRLRRRLTAAKASA
jgi:hypothetical protein